jgi:hypothetical protein
MVQLVMVVDSWLSSFTSTDDCQGMVPRCWTADFNNVSIIMDEIVPRECC